MHRDAGTRDEAAGQGRARQGKAGQGRARQGMAGQGVRGNRLRPPRGRWSSHDVRSVAPGCADAASPCPSAPGGRACIQQPRRSRRTRNVGTVHPRKGHPGASLEHWRIGAHAFAPCYAHGGTDARAVLRSYADLLPGDSTELSARLENPRLRRVQMILVARDAHLPCSSTWAVQAASLCQRVRGYVGR